MKRILVFVTLALIAAACSSSPQSVSTPVTDLQARVPSTGSSHDVTGLLEVTVSGFEKNSSAGTASAKFYGVDKSGKLSAKGLLVPNSSVAFTPQFVSSFDTFSGATTTRYVEAGFNITNNSPTTYYNMTMVASSLIAATTSSGVVTTVGGTALSDIFNGGGGAITDVAVARSMIPVHGFTAGFTYAPNVNLADLHYLTAAEAASVKALGQASGQIPAINVNKVLPLEYGFVSRNAAGTGRTISPSTCVGTNCNKGKVTFAYSFPLDANIAKQPYAYKVWYVVANEYIPTWSQMLNDDAVGGVSTVAGVPYANPLIATHRTRILEYRGAGKTFVPSTGLDTLDNVCSIKTANAAGVDPALKYPVVNPNVPGAWDGCFGEGGVRGRTYTTSFNTSSSISVDPATNNVVIAGTKGGSPTSVLPAIASQYGDAIVINRFDATGKQNLSASLAMTSFPTLALTNGVDFVSVKRVIVSAASSQIVVFGVIWRQAGFFDAIVPTPIPFVLRFSSSGVLNGFRYLDSQGEIMGGNLYLPTGDIFVSQTNSATPDIYVTYTYDSDMGPSERSILLTRLDGSTSSTTIPMLVVSGFGTAGTYSNVFSGYSLQVSRLVLANGKLITIGYDPTNSSILTISALGTGLPDTSWDGDGLASFTTAQTTLASGLIVTSASGSTSGAVTIAGDGKSAAALTTDPDYFVLRTTATGGIDGSFGTAGKTVVDCATAGSINKNPQIATRTNGELFLVGQTGAPGSTGHCVARLNATGSLISSQNYDMYFGQVKIPANDAQFTSTGKLVIGGTSGTSAIVGQIKQ
jgi:hypothetical protein